MDTTGRRLSFEWALIDGVNDRDSDIDELARYAPVAARARQPHPAQPDAGLPGARFVGPARARLSRRTRSRCGVNATVRNTRGRSIDAACGQLAAVTNARHKSIPVRSALRSSSRFQNVGRHRIKTSTPTMHAMPPETMENSVEVKLATTPDSTSPRRGPPVTTAI